MVTFRAGRCTYENNTITPLPGKGKVELTVDESNILHVVWSPRSSSSSSSSTPASPAPLDLIVFPGDAKFSSIPCPTGRVTLLRFTSGRKVFFWLQEPNADADDALFVSANEALTNPPAPPSQGGLEGMDQESFRNLMAAAASGRATPAERAQLQRMMLEAQAARARGGRRPGAGGGAGRAPPSMGGAGGGAPGGAANNEAAFQQALNAALAESAAMAQGGAPGGGDDAIPPAAAFGGFGGAGMMDDDAQLQAAIQASLMESQGAGNDNDDDGNDQGEGEDGAVEDIDDDDDTDRDLYQS